MNTLRNLQTVPSVHKQTKLFYMQIFHEYFPNISIDDFACTYVPFKLLPLGAALRKIPLQKQSTQPIEHRKPYHPRGAPRQTLMTPIPVTRRSSPGSGNDPDPADGQADPDAPGGRGAPAGVSGGAGAPKQAGG